MPRHCHATGQVASPCSPPQSSRSDDGECPISPPAELTGASGQEQNHRRRTDGRILAGEGQRSCLLVHPEAGNCIAALVARVEEVPAWINSEASGIIAARPLLACERQRTGGSDGEPGDAVVQSIGRIDKSRILRNRHLGSEVRPCKAFRQSGYSLPRRQPSFCAVVVEQHQSGRFFLETVQPALIRVEREMSRSIAGRKRYRWWIIGSQLPGFQIELPDQNPIESEVDRQNESARRIGLESCARASDRGR